MTPRHHDLTRGLVCMVMLGLAGCKTGQTRPVEPVAVTPATTAPVASEADDKAAEENPDVLAARANNAYEAGDYRACAEGFARVSGMASDLVVKSTSYNAACCWALAGEVDHAFAELDRAVAAGYRDFGHITKDPDLVILHPDPRWQAALGKIRAAWEAYRASINAELLDIHDADQADRMVDRPEDIDWSQVSVRDRERRARVAEIVAAGGARVAADYYHAAMVYQHGDKVEDFKQAHEWARRAVELDPEHGAARWLAAAAEDRWLVNQGKPQKYGTQFRAINGRWELYQVDPSITDEERARWNVPPIAEARKRAEAMNQARGIDSPASE